LSAIEQFETELLRFQYVEFGGRPPSWIRPEIDLHNLMTRPLETSMSDFNTTRQ